MSEYAVLAFLGIIPFALIPRTQVAAVYVAAIGAGVWMIIRAPALLHAVSSARAFGGG